MLRTEGAREIFADEITNEISLDDIPVGTLVVCKFSDWVPWGETELCLVLEIVEDLSYPSYPLTRVFLYDFSKGQIYWETTRSLGMDRLWVVK